jgi:hypothetical protein
VWSRHDLRIPVLRCVQPPEKSTVRLRAAEDDREAALAADPPSWTVSSPHVGVSKRIWPPNGASVQPTEMEES